jgi:DNA-binding transcriptional regulator YiaG
MSKKVRFSKDKPHVNRYLFDKPNTTREDFLSDIVHQFIIRRQELNLSQEDIDLRMGNADRQCSKWECGLRTPTSFNLLCWAEALKAQLILSPNDV